MSFVIGGTTRQRGVRTAVSSLALAGMGAALTLTVAAAPATAAPAAHQHHAVTHHVSATHVHHARHARKFVVTGLAKHRHGRTITVFAKTEKLGHKTRHDKKVTITFAKGVRAHLKHAKHGAKIHLVARGHGSLKHFVVRHNDTENTNDAPATLIFGTITQENGSLLVVSENDRDNGDNQDGTNDQGDDNPGDGNDNVARDHGDGGGDGHQVVVDASGATTVELDGAEGSPVVGDEVAILGEVTDNTVIADAVYGFSNPQSFLRGHIRAINGSTVAISGGNDGEGNDHARGDHGDDGNTQLVNLNDVPLFINGSMGSTLDQLKVGDKILVIGAFSLTDNSFTPSLAFVFNGHDDHPCGDNGDDNGDGGHDGPGDGGSDG